MRQVRTTTEQRGVSEAASKLLGTAAVVLLLDQVEGYVVESFGIDVTTLSRRTSFCAWSLLPVLPEALVVPDATKDPRFSDNPLVIGEPHMRAYAGAPILRGQHRLGSLCCVGTTPRDFSAEDKAILCNLAHIYAAESEVLAVCQSGRVLCCSGSFREAFGAADDIVFGDDLTFRSHRLFRASITTPRSPHTIPFSSIRHEDARGDVYMVSDRPLPDMTSNLYQVKLRPIGLMGKGPHGQVYRGTSSQAIKVMPMLPHLSSLEINKKLRALEHINVMSVSHFAMTSDRMGCVVMPLVPGGSLMQLVETGYFRTTGSFYDGSVDLARVVDVATQVALGMTHLHRLGFIHGNLHGGNVLWCPKSARALVTDFLGLEALTRAEDTRGHLTHCAPEVLQDGIATHACDIYSWGVLLWMLSTSRRPWAGLLPDAVVAAKCTGASALLFPADLPDSLRDLGGRCLLDDFTRRPRFDEILAMLKAVAVASVQDFAVYGDR